VIPPPSHDNREDSHKLSAIPKSKFPYVRIAIFRHKIRSFWHFESAISLKIIRLLLTTQFLILFSSNVSKTKLRTWFSDLFAASFIFLATTGLFMIQEKKEVTGRGAWLVILGIIIPLIFLIIYLWRFKGKTDIYI
jgi:hypothetical protein